MNVMPDKPNLALEERIIQFWDGLTFEERVRLTNEAVERLENPPYFKSQLTPSDDFTPGLWESLP